ncbi:MAG: DUF2628 domain-containing protein [Alphaproteobacteria bacterium]|nr:DUF2628 domain-containing protein [Alphaproteobacteria bacterium]
MRIWSVAARGNGRGEPDIVLVKEGFCWPAFLFGPVWFLWHRLWLALLGYLGANILLAGALALFGVNPAQQLLASLVLALLVGWHGNDLRRWTLLRRGYRLVELVVARDEGEAEKRSLEKLAGRVLALQP